MPFSRPDGSALLAAIFVCALACALCACGEEAGDAGSVGPCETREASATLRGQVTTPSCAETVAGVEVELHDELLLNRLGTATTDGDGEFSFDRPAPGRYILLGKKGPYTARSDVFEVAGTCPYQILVLR